MLTHADEQRQLLAQCASEPIQWLGRTQAFGLLLAFHPVDRRVVACSANARDWLGRTASALQDLDVDDLLSRRNVDAACAHAAIAAVLGDRTAPAPGGLARSGRSRSTSRCT